MNKQKIQEGKELDLLNGKNGFTIETKLFGRKKIWKASFFPLGLMDKQSDLYHQLEVDYTQKSVAALLATNVKKNASICAEIIAVTVLAKPWKIFLFRKVLKRHFLWQVDSAKLMSFTNQLINASNYKDFMTSIGLMSVSTVTAPISETQTKADPVEGLEVPSE